MRIVIVLDSFHLGGAEILAMRLARKFLRENNKVFFIALRGEGEINRQLEEMGVEFYAINSEQGVCPSAMFRIYLLLRKIDADILLTNHFRPLLHSWLAALLSRTLVYHVEHDSLHYRTRELYVTTLRFLLLGIKKMIVISPSLYTYFAQKIHGQRKKLVTIVNGVDQEHFFPAAEEIKSGTFAAENVVFGTCARLVPVKNIDLMLDIFHAYRRKFHCGHLILVGEGVCRQQLEQKVAQYDLQENVTFTGYQQDCAPWYQLMDYYLLTSDDEGLPLSVLEAMACGVVIVSRDVGDMKRLLQDGGGRIVYSTESTVWLDTLKDIDAGSEKYLQLSQQAVNIIEEKYSFANCAEQYLQLFSDKQV